MYLKKLILKEVSRRQRKHKNYPAYKELTEKSLFSEHLWVLLPDAFLVLFSELLVDWGKHAFVLKFNEIPADVSFVLVPYDHQASR